jgi:hypothetical protein
MVSWQASPDIADCAILPALSRETQPTASKDAMVNLTPKLARRSFLASAITILLFMPSTVQAPNFPALA